MGLYSTTRTIDATKSEIAEMVRAQEKVMELLARKDLDASIVKNSFGSFSAGVLGLIFVAKTVASVASGFISLITSLNASEKQWLKDDVTNGHTELLRTYMTMSEGNWAKCNMTLTENRERPGYEFAFVKSRKVNNFTTPGGEVAIQ